MFHVHGGPKEGREGVYLAKGQVEGIYDAPVRTTWKTGAFQVGSKQRHRKWLHRDMELGFHIKETRDTWAFNDSEFRRMFDYEVDEWDTAPTPTTIEIETELSGVRKLDVLMYEEPEFAPDVDPQFQQFGNVIMKLRAGQPMWYETAANTASGFHESAGSSSVTVHNPTDQIMYHKWILGVGNHTLPDRSWVGKPGSRTIGGAFSARNITGISVTGANGGAVVDLDRQELMFRDKSNTNILAQLAGQLFAFPIPPYTPPRSLPVGGSGTKRLVMPRRWSRPWGLEL